MSDRPYPGEGLGEFRARRARELADQAKGVGSGPSADDQVEAAKAKVRADNAAKAQARVADPKNAVNHLDDAAEKDDQVKAVHKKLAGGVKALDMDAIKAADRDKSWAGKSPEEQAAVAKGAKPAHSTSTPGAAPTPAVGAAMKAAGAAPKPAIKVSPEVGARARREPSPAPSPSVAAHNNMGVPRGGDKGGVLAGATSKDSPDELARARAAATKGSRGTGNKQAEANAARASSRRSAAAAAPARASVAPQPQGVFAGSRMAQAHAAALGFSGPSSKMSDKPAPGPSQHNAQIIKSDDMPTVPNGGPAPRGPRYAQGLGTPVAAANPAPAAPAPVAPNSGETAADRASATASGPLKHVIGRGLATKGSGTAPGHMVSSAPGRDWLTPQQVKAAKKSAPRAAVVEPQPDLKAAESRHDAELPAPSAVKAAGPGRPVSGVPLPPATHANKMQPAQSVPQMPAKSPAPPAPSRTPVPQNTPMSSQMPRAAATAAPAGPPTPPKPPTRSAASPVTPPTPPAPPAPSGPVASPRASTPVAGPSAPTGAGRPGVAAPRSPEIGGGRGGIHQGGEHNVNVGGDNYGNITHNHNTYNVNHGVNYGSMGNVDHGYAPRGGSGGGRATPGGRAPHEAHEVHNDLWVKDVNGTHSLRKGIQHVTGQTGGHGEKMPTTKPTAGNQRPIAGSSRQAGNTTGTSGAAPATNNTGTTHNWTGPVHQAPTSASGNGTALPAHPMTTP